MFVLPGKYTVYYHTWVISKQTRQYYKKLAIVYYYLDSGMMVVIQSSKNHLYKYEKMNQPSCILDNMCT